MAGTIDTTLGNALPLGYGLVRGTGLQIIDETITATAPAYEHFYNLGDVISDGTNLQICTTPGLSGSSFPTWNHSPGGTTGWGAATFTNLGTTGGSGYQYGAWLLGEGEWDGFETIWNQVTPLFIIGNAYDISSGAYNAGPPALNPPEIHFHSGTDGAFGASAPVPSSNGPDQGCDNWISELPAGAAILPQCYSRMAWYMMKWLPKWLFGSNWNIQQSGLKMSPLGDWRALRCRIFDDMGTQTGYQWTQNPAWHWVDAILRCCVFPRSEYQLNMSSGPPFTTTAQALDSVALGKFDWGSIYEFAQDCDYVLGNGKPRFQGNYYFGSQTPLGAILEQILTICKGYMQEYAGKLFLKMDKPRVSTFLLSDKHYSPGSLKADQKEVKQNANEYTYEYLDTEIPAIVEVDSITWVESDGFATIVTVQKHPCAPWDQIEIGGNSNSILNRGWQVANIIDDYTFTAGTNDDFHADESGTGGLIGYPQSRFTKRAPRLWHLQHSIARGQIGP